MSPLNSTRRPRRLAVLTALVAALVGLFAAQVAHADFSDYGIESVDASLSTTQAGGHPDLTTTIELKVDGSGAPHARTKDVSVELPPGLVGDPTGIPTCTMLEFQAWTCPTDSQVGVAILDLYGLGPGTMPIWNMAVPKGDQAARLAFYAVVHPIFIDVDVRTDSDYGVTATVRDASGQAGLVEVTTVLWGNPAAPIHDTQRMTWIEGPNCGFPCFAPNGVSRESGLSEVPFITNPTSCGPKEVGFRTTSYARPEEVHTAAAPLADITGCDRVGFEPGITVQPTSRAAASPTGLDVEVTLPQVDAINTPSSGHLRDAQVTLPEGMTIAAGAAEGLTACTAAQAGYGTLRPSSCPRASKIGAASFDVPVLPQKLEGGIYVRRSAPGRLLRIWLVASGLGVNVKIPGEVIADPVTGRLTAVFTDNPQTPLRGVSLHFKGGPRGILTNPRACGTYATQAELAPWSGTAPVALEDRMTIDQGCATGGFAPGFAAGASNPAAGAFSAFAARITRDSGEKELGRIDVDLPRGMLANLSHLERCTGAQIAEASGRSGAAAQGVAACPIGSQIGTVTVGAGEGSAPFYPRLPGTDVSGRVFLTEAYSETTRSVPGAGAPRYGMLFEVPAVAGPYDLGTVLVRAAVFVDPVTAELTVLSDPLPRILEGIPLNLRDVRVNIDRERFTVNPTSCAEQQVGGTIHAQDGSTAARSSRFQVGDCAALGFDPQIRLALKGRRQARTGGHPAVRAVVSQPDGQAAIRRAVVRLPKSLALDPDNAQALCEFEDGTKPDLENHCPEGSIVGRSRAVTPLLDEDLVGNVYFVKNVRIDPDTGNEIRTLPMLVVALRGEIAINLVGESSTMKNGRLVNTFAQVPDAPVSRFNLNLEGGSNGILTVTRTRRSEINLCTAGRQIAAAKVAGQNRKRADQRILVRTPCPKRRKAAVAVCRKRVNGKAAVRRCVTKVKRNRAQARRAAQHKVSQRNARS